MKTSTYFDRLAPEAKRKRARIIEILEARIAPAVTVLNVDSLAIDADGDGLADPGDQIHYTVTVQNTGPGSIDGMSFQDIINDPNLSLVEGSINVSPLAIDDSFNAVGNTVLRVGGSAGSSPEVFVAGGSLLANDFEFLGDSFAVTPVVNGTTTLGGTFSLNADGTFTYVSQAGDTGTDSFTYTVRDDGIDGIAGNADDLTSTATVNITLTGKIWYVDNTAAAGGTGTSSAPFMTLSAAQAASGTGDTIYVATGSGTYSGTLTLKGAQTLWGANETLTAVLPAGTPSGQVTLASAGTAPVLTNAGGTVITLATGNTLKGFTVGNSTRDILGNNFGSLSVSNVTLNGTGKALDLTNGSFIPGSSFNSITSTGTAAGLQGISLTTVGGSVNFGSVTISNSSAQGIFVLQSTGTFNFGNTSVTANGGSTEGVRLQTNPNATFTFGTLSIVNSTGIAFSHTSDGGKTTVTGLTTITNPGGIGILIFGALGTHSVTFANVSNTSSSGTGVVLGTATVGQGNTAAITFGDLDISPDAGQRAFQAQNNSGTITVNGGTISTTTATAIDLINNTGTFNFAGGGLVVSTTSGTAFTASGGGTVSVTGAGNTIDATSGTALNLNGTTIAAAGLTFQRISSGAGSNVGISLVNTGSNGGLTVTGLDGSDADSFADAGSGGIISDKSGADGSTTAGIGIFLSNTRNVSLAGMGIGGNQNFGIRGLNVVNFTLSDSVIGGTNGNNAALDEGSVAFNELTGSATVTRSSIGGSVKHNLSVINTSGTLDRITISNTTFGTMNAATGGDALRIESLNTAVIKATVENNTFTAAVGSHFYYGMNSASSSLVGDVVFRGNTITNTLTAAPGGGGVRVVGGSDASGLNGSLTFEVSNNTIRDSRGTALVVNHLGGTGTYSGTIAGNTIGVAGVANSGSLEGSGILVAGAGNGALQATISGNTISQYNNHGILTRAGGSGVAGSGTVSLTVAGNTVSNPGTNLAAIPAEGLNGFHLEAGTTAGDAYQIYLTLGGAGASKNNFAGSGADPHGGGFGQDIRLRQQQSTTVHLTADDASGNPTIEYTGANTDTTAVANFVIAHNSPATASASVNAPPGGGFIGGAAPLLFAPNEAAQAPVVAESVPSATEPAAVSPGTSITVSPEISESTTLTSVSAGSGVATVSPESVDDGRLSQTELDALLQAAITRWQATGLTSEQVALLQSAVFTVSDLPGWYLGKAGATITLDVDAAGNGWFVDSTPLEDSEFSNSAGRLSATADGGATGRIDALTTIMHELGHVLGLSDTYSASEASNLMYGYLHAGERRVASANQAEGAVPDDAEHSGFEFLFGPMSLGAATLPAGRSLTIVYDQTINATVTATQVSSQISFTSSAGTVLSDDPSLGGAANPTRTLIDRPDVTVTLTVNTPTFSFEEDIAEAFTFTFTRQGPTTDAWAANFSVSGTANSSDYTFAAQPGVTFDPVTGSGTVTFAAGQSTAAVEFGINADTAVEPDETLEVILDGGDNYDVGTPAMANATIVNDDTDVSVSLAPASVFEDGAGNLVYTFTRVGVTANSLTANFSLGGSAEFNGSDYSVGFVGGTATFNTGTGTGTITFAPGETTVSITVDPVADSIVEYDETVVASVTGGAGYNVAGPAATGGIANDDMDIVLSVAPASLSEDGAGNLVYTFTRIGFTGTDVMVNFDVGGTATFNTDYTEGGAASFTALNGTVLIPSGATSATIRLTPINDTLVEGSENTSLTLVAGTGYGIATPNSANGTFADNDFATVAFAADSSNVGEAAGSHDVGVTLLITANGVAGDGTLAQNVSVNLQDLLTGSATGAGSDYAFASPATIDFAAGEASSTRNATIALVNDTRVEGNETIRLQLNTLVDGTGGQVSLAGSMTHVATVNDNDTATVSLAANSSSFSEAAGSQNIGVTLLITANGVAGTGTLERSVSINLQDLLTGTATGGGSDYTFANPQTITFASGVGSSTQNATLSMVDDTRLEGNESVVLQTSNFIDGTGGQVSFAGGNTHTVTILENESATITMAAAASFVNEGAGSHAAGVTLVITANGVPNSGTLDRNLSVSLADLQNGSATGGGVDYTFNPQVVTFAAGESSSTKSVSFPIVDDLTSEGTETLRIGLGNLNDGSGGFVSVVNPTTQLTAIVDNDIDLHVTIAESADLVIAGSGAGNLTYTITLRNVGLTDATGIIVGENLTLPTGVSVVSVTPSAGNFTTTAGPDGNWSVSSLAAGAEVTLTVVLTVDASAPAGVDIISNGASILDANEVLVNLSDDQASESTSVDGQGEVPTYKGIYAVSPGLSLPWKHAGPSVVRVFDVATNTELFTLTPYGSSYQGSIRIAVGDINGDGFDDIITSTREGDGSVRVFDGTTGARLGFSGGLMEIAAFPEAGARGAFVASGDVNGDGRDDIIVGSGHAARGNGTVRVFDGITGALLSSQEPFGKFKGGVRVAVGDVNGDGLADIIAAQGIGGNEVKVTSGMSNTVLHQFEIGGNRYHAGVFVAAGDLNGDGSADLVVSRDKKPALIETFDGETGALISKITPFDSRLPHGVRVAVTDFNLDGIADIIAGIGGIKVSQVKIFDGATSSLLHSFTAFPSLAISTLFVAGTSPVPRV